MYSPPIRHLCLYLTKEEMGAWKNLPDDLKSGELIGSKRRLVDKLVVAQVVQRTEGNLRFRVPKEQIVIRSREGRRRVYVPEIDEQDGLVSIRKAQSTGVRVMGMKGSVSVNIVTMMPGWKLPLERLGILVDGFDERGVRVLCLCPEGFERAPLQETGQSPEDWILPFNRPEFFTDERDEGWQVGIASDAQERLPWRVAVARVRERLELSRHAPPAAVAQVVHQWTEEK